MRLRFRNFALVGLLTCGCNAFSGAGEYEDVQRCTGPMCGVCPAGQHWDSERGVCIDETAWCSLQGRQWDPEQLSCLPPGSCPMGQRWYAAKGLCVLDCAAGTMNCGAVCCSQTQYCVGQQEDERCSACEKAEYECGNTCCEKGATCLDASRGVCAAQYGISKQSCAGGLDCDGESCCSSIDLPAGAFPQGSPDSDAKAFDDQKPERSVTVSAFALDKFEVTVGRFRKFVKEWDYQPPPPGAGAHPRIGNSGWHSAWNHRLPGSVQEFETRLKSCFVSTYGKSQLNVPIGCVGWYEAFAFCVWDGGRLPTEAEWEYAATGGEENRNYPWGSSVPSSSLAAYGCGYDGDATTYSHSDIASVTSLAAGEGRWGHHHLAGNMWEWVLDVYDNYPVDDRADYANTADIPIRTLRGGSWYDATLVLRAAHRFGEAYAPTYRYVHTGLRCARAVSQ